MKKCVWSIKTDIEGAYHDIEWGVPVHDDRLLFEFIVLEGAQAGLSWLTILKKRDGYRHAFDNFEVIKVAAYDEDKIQQLLLNPDIVRNKLKIKSAVTNACAFLKVQQEFGSFDSYLWHFVDNKPVQNNWKSQQELPASSHLSDLISRDLKKRGFKFMGSTICYAFMQAIGMINDHTVDCYRHRQLQI
ncbi:DNA-3-methyladenine glycosylase I [Crenothrix polyspora]|uniref:DNA-3-methyladenine glycosylase I n=1 Tax=Crenothrix polyspora TaxID=360316 RepID=A0A1R4H115_9GAMM|nr:DNA-3-methyladenine glycosylase I [Crenothrix polyspora]SJM89943.1 GMP synthase [Crenothrix polyspora]